MFYGRTIALSLLCLGASALAEPSRTVLLDVSVQSKGSTRSFVYNTSPLIPIGEISKLPVKSSATDAENLELRVLATSPQGAAGKNLLDVQIELVSFEAGGDTKVLGQVKVLTRLNESVAASDNRDPASPLLFTLTPLEIQNP